MNRIEDLTVKNKYNFFQLQTLIVWRENNNIDYILATLFADFNSYWCYLKVVESSVSPWSPRATFTVSAKDCDPLNQATFWGPILTTSNVSNCQRVPCLVLKKNKTLPWWVDPNHWNTLFYTNRTWLKRFGFAKFLAISGISCKRVDMRIAWAFGTKK